MKQSGIKIICFLLVWIFFHANIVSGSEAVEKKPETTDETIKIAAAFSKTGKWASWEKPFYEVLAFAADELNRKGGLLGKPIEIIEFDMQSTIVGARLVGKQAVKAGVIAAIGTSGSSSAMALAPILQEAGILMITPIATNPDVTKTGNYIFRVCFIDPFQGAVMANFARRDLGAETAAALTNTSNSYSVGLANIFMEQFRKTGGAVAWEGEYIQDTYDYKELLEKVNALAPDVVFLPGYQKDSARIIKQARNMGVTATFLGGDAWSDIMYEIGGEAIHGGYYTNHWHRGAGFEESRLFLKAYEKDHDAVSHPAFALAYDAVMILAEAIKQAQSADPDRIRDALSGIRNYRGVTGNISFDENRNPVKPAVILKFENKSSVYVKAVAP